MKEKKYKDLIFIKYSVQQDWKEIREDEDNIYYEVYAGENLSQTILKASEYTNQMNPLF